MISEAMGKVPHDLHIVYLNVKKAFDSVSHKTLIVAYPRAIDCLSAVHLPKQLNTALQVGKRRKKWLVDLGHQ